MAAKVLEDVRPSGWAVKGEAKTNDGTVEAAVTFQTAQGRGLGFVRLRPEGCWTLLTSLEALSGHEEACGPRRQLGHVPRPMRHRETWAEQRAREQAELGVSRQPYVVIVGGGQSGMTLAARLKRLEVPTVVLEKSPRAGDIWRNRYQALCLHDPVWVCHLPYMPFPDHWPLYASKDKVADWFEMYASVMELDYWTSSTCTSAVWDEAGKEWAVSVSRGGQRVQLRPKHVVVATGLYGLPHVPHFPGAESFQGSLLHSSRYTCGADYAGKKAVVIGSNTSAHDVCQDLWEQGVDVTMLQRSSTAITTVESMREVLLKDLYSEEALAKGITTEEADLTMASVPYKVLAEQHKVVCKAMQEYDADILQRLRGAGFLLDFGDDDSGVFMKFLRRGSGYYFDVGASQLIADGSVKLKTGKVDRISEAGVITDDGTELPADLVVLATGYQPMASLAATFMEKETIDKLGTVWGLGSDTTGDPGPWEGELRNMWKPTAQEGLWLHGGNLLQNRIYSHVLALQLKARQAGIPTPVYGFGSEVA
uniref:FAD/NAD(P)-binding domain-containing protein n=1 Tax=Alexandrium catenella TaxID=2925 RepID=A0A7S1RRB2_ALECA